MRKIVFFILLAFLVSFLVLIFIPENPEPLSSVNRDPTGFGAAYGSALGEIVGKVIWTVFGIVTVITILLGITLFKKK